MFIRKSNKERHLKNVPPRQIILFRAQNYSNIINVRTLGLTQLKLLSEFGHCGYADTRPTVLQLTTRRIIIYTPHKQAKIYFVLIRVEFKIPRAKSVGGSKATNTVAHTFTRIEIKSKFSPRPAARWRRFDRQADVFGTPTESNVLDYI